MIRENIHTCFVVFLFSPFVLYSFQYTDLSTLLLRNFDSFLLPFVDKVTAKTYNFVSLIVKTRSEILDMAGFDIPDKAGREARRSKQVIAKRYTLHANAIMLSGLALVLSPTATAKTQCFIHLSFNSTFQLINGISIDLQKLLRYFKGTATVVSPKIPFTPSPNVNI